MNVWVVMWSYDWEENCAVFATEEQAKAFALSLFGIDDWEDLTDAYEAGPWKAFLCAEREVG